ncbi:MAG: hypothetical protein Q7J34_13585 [Bacteroidales bacterium]|jgi:hypothetical protein|nr:hypothetical protein [Bacteroidales bacterium]
MKKLLSLLLFSGFLILVSCSKDIPDSPDIPTTIDNLVVDKTFDWESTQSVDLSMTGYANSTATISSADGTILWKAFLTKNEPNKVTFTLPSADSKITLNYMGQSIELALTGKPISYIFN